MRLIQNSTSYREFRWPSRAGTQPLFSGLWDNRKAFFDPTLFISSLTFLWVLFLHYNLILFKICQFLCSVCFGTLFSVFSLLLLSLFFVILFLFLVLVCLVLPSLVFFFTSLRVFIFVLSLFSFGNN